MNYLNCIRLRFMDIYAVLNVYDLGRETIWASCNA